jgi:hypothetical protein
VISSSTTADDAPARIRMTRSLAGGIRPAVARR